MLSITEVRVKLIEGSKDRLRAFCTITFDDAFVVLDLKIIDGGDGAFVAMPSRKLNSHCPKCSGKNPVRVSFCNSCGARMEQSEPEGRDQVYADVAHPINAECRRLIQDYVLRAYREELNSTESESAKKVPACVDSGLRVTAAKESANCVTSSKRDRRSESCRSASRSTSPTPSGVVQPALKT